MMSAYVRVSGTRFNVACTAAEDIVEPTPGVDFAERELRTALLAAGMSLADIDVLFAPVGQSTRLSTQR